MTSWLVMPPKMNCFHQLTIALSLAVFLFTSPSFAQDENGAAAIGIANSAGSAPEPLFQAEDNANQMQAAESASDVAATADTSISGGQSPFRADLSTHHLTFGDRVQIYRHSVFSPLTVIGPTVGAGFGLWENEPPEWGQGMAGYGRRFGSSIGRTLTNKTIVFGVAALDGEDPRYFPSEQSGLLPRSRHAVVSTFVSARSNGSRMPAISLFAGAYSSAFIANSWYPSSKATTRHAMEQGSFKLVSTVGLHLLREFWPDIKRTIHLHK